ncbi:unnamed protein product, partial [Polarella glacialis]
ERPMLPDESELDAPTLLLAAYACTKLGQKQTFLRLLPPLRKAFLASLEAPDDCSSRLTPAEIAKLAWMLSKSTSYDDPLLLQLAELALETPNFG